MTCAKLVSPQKYPGSVSTLHRITRGKGGGHHLRRQALAIEDVVRNDGTVVIEIQNAFSRQAFENGVGFGDALLVIEPIVELVTTPLGVERQPTDVIFLPLKRLGGEE